MSGPDPLHLSHVEAYFRGWNARDASAVARSFSSEGRFCDVTLQAPVAASALEGAIAPLFVALPDFTITPDEIIGSAGRYVAEWTLSGSNLGAFLPGVIATHKSLTLRGVDVLEVSERGVESVDRYFDQKAFFEGMGLMVLVQPIQQGVANYGYSMRVASENPRPPGVIALTWIQGANEGEKERIRAHSRENVKDFLGEPGFISIVTGFTGLRGFTVTAWEDEEAMKRALSKHHAVAMKELFSENFVASVWTSVWTPTRMNRIWVRCQGCGSLENVNDDHRACSRCSAALPPRPAFW